MWRNALAFGSLGEHDLAFALAGKLHEANDTEIREAARRLAAFYVQRGHAGIAKLKDPWRYSALSSLGKAAILLAMPAILIGLIISENNAKSSEGASILGAPVPQGTEVPKALDEARSAPVPTCAKNISNGQILAGKSNLLKDGHVLQIDNGGGGDVIVKVRQENRKLIASFYIRNGASAELTGIPDGKYYVQYASGPSLAADCKSFTAIEGASQFPGPEHLRTEYTEEFNGTRITRQQLRYTLYAVPSGNVRPILIDEGAFQE